MVTLDRIVKNVPQFTDIKAGRKQYESAKQGSELVKKACADFEETLKASTGFSELNLPKKPTDTVITVGSVTFQINSATRTRRPQYKSVVEEMESYIRGISFLDFQGKTISGVIKEDNLQYMRADVLLEAFEIKLAAYLIPEVRHKITYSLENKLEASISRGVDKVELSEQPGHPNEENAVNYIKMGLISDNLKNYQNEYEKALAAEEQKPEGVVPVTKDKAYEPKTSERSGPDWAYVVKKLLHVPTDASSEGELNRLADTDLDFSEKKRLPYQILEREVRGVDQTYVSLKSVYNRIQQLKGAEVLTFNRIEVKPKEII